MSKSTSFGPWTTVSVLAVAPSGSADVPGRALLRTAQRLTPPGMRLDLFDGAAPDAAAALRDALAEHDALLLVTDGTTATADALAALVARGPDAWLRDVTAAVVCPVNDPRADAGIQRLRQALRAARACLMPPYDLRSADDRVLRRLLGDLRVWAQEAGCGSVLSPADDLER